MLNIFRNRHKGDLTTYRFDSIMRTLSHMLAGADFNTKINVLDYTNYIIKNQLKGELMTYCLNEPRANDGLWITPFPAEVFDENGSRIKYETREHKTIDLADDMVFVRAREFDRMQRVLKKVYDRGFITLDNHDAAYYTEIDFTLVKSGCHSISAGVFYKDGIIKANVCHTEMLFSHMYSDGECWYNSHTNVELANVSDFRIAALFEIAKMKNDLLKDTQQMQQTLY